MRNVTIENLCATGDAHIQTGPFGSQLHAYDYVKSGTPVVSTEAIGDRQINHAALPHISQEKALELARHALQPGDILFARRGVQATGKAALVRNAEVGFLCGTGAILLRLRRPYRVVLPDYLSHVLASHVSRDWFQFHAIGATMPNLNEGIIRRFSFAAPSIDDQKIICNALNSLDDKINLNRRMNETLEAMARVLFKDWFVDFGPTRAKLEGRVPYLAPDIWSLFPDRLDDNGKPDGWLVEPLLQHARLVSGGTPKTDIPAFWNGPISWASAKDVSQCADSFLINTERSITERGLNESATRIVPKLATAVVARGATTGRFCLLGRDMAMNQTCYALAPKQGLPFWLNCAFASLVDTLVQSAHGSVFDTITTTTLEQARVTISSAALLKRFESTVSPLFTKMLANIEEAKSLADTRDLLLPKLMSGEIRVKDAEKMAETVP